METAKSGNTKMIIHFIISCAFCFLFRFLPPFGSLTPYGMAVLGIFIGMVYGWCVSANNLIWPALLGMIALGLTDYGTCANVMANAFASDSLVLTIMGLLFVACLQESGLTDYLAKKLLTIPAMQGHPWIFTLVLIMVPGLLSQEINAMVVVLIMFSMYGSIFQQAGYKKGDLYPAFLIMGLMIGVCIHASWFPFKGFPLLTMAVANPAGITFDHVAWMATVIPSALIAQGAWVLIMRIFPGVDASKMSSMNLEALGGNEKTTMTKMQKAVLIALVANLTGCILISFLGGSVGWRAYVSKFGVYGWVMLILVLCMIIKIDGTPILNNNTMGRYVYWDLIIVMAASLCVAGVLTTPATGISTMVSALLMPIFNMGEFTFLFFLAVITFILTNFLNNLSITITMASVTISMYGAGVVFNVHLALTLIAVLGLFGLLTPAGSAYGAMIHSNEWTTTKSAYTAGFTMMLWMAIVIALVFIPLGMKFM